MKYLAPASLILEELAARINREHHQCQAAPTTGLLHARNAGDWLLQIHAQFPPEKWLPWLAAHCAMSAQTAQTYMQIAKAWPRMGSSVTGMDGGVSDYPPSVRTLKAFEEQPDELAAKEKGIADLSIAAIAEPVSELVDSPSGTPELNPRNTTLQPAPSIPKKNSKTPTAATYIFWIPGRVTPKARPRVTANGTFLPARYRQWRVRAEGELIMQLQKMNPPPKLPIQQAAVRIVLHGQHRGDGDNSIGSVCDALVSAGVLPSDSLKHLPYGSWRHIAGEETGVHIEIKPLLEPNA